MRGHCCCDGQSQLEPCAQPRRGQEQGRDTSGSPTDSSQVRGGHTPSRHCVMAALCLSRSELLSLHPGDGIFSPVSFKPCFHQDDIKMTVWKHLHRRVLSGSPCSPGSTLSGQPRWCVGQADQPPSHCPSLSCPLLACSLPQENSRSSGWSCLMPIAA